MRFQFRTILLASVAFGLMAGAATAVDAADGRYFTRLATLPIYQNLPQGTDSATETSAEIVSATDDGMMLVYTDSPMEAVGFVDISDPANPKPAGLLKLGGEPTSVTVAKNVALVGVNTSESFVEPSGHLAVVDLDGRAVTARCDVKGQPDSVAKSPDGAFLAVVVENERDEDKNDGALPQLPAGHLAVFDLGGDGQPTNCDTVRIVALAGLAEVAADDPEPEYVDINADNMAVVTLQENNHLMVVDLAAGKVSGHFSAGAVDLSAIDTDKDKVIAGIGTLSGVPREPDAVSWIDNDRFVTANEGDYKGGSRGFTVFDKSGTVLFDSGNALEHIGMSHGHYPVKRASKKGVEPEGVDVGVYGGTPLMFVNSERGNFVLVYEDKGAGAAPELVQFLPTSVGPEGLLAIPSRNLFVVATEEDSAEDKVRATLAIFRREGDRPFYPTIVSDSDTAVGAPIGWGALSGLVADPADANRVYAVSDSFYESSRIFTVDIGASPARITDFVELKKDGQRASYDLEGIALRQGGGFWAVSEGHPGKEKMNYLLAVTTDGTVEQEITLPEDLRANAVRFGFEGVASWTENGEETLVVAVQREWKDDPKQHVKLAFYKPASGEWSFAHYPMEAPRSPAGGWVGLSEITHLGEKRFALIERDNQGGTDAAIKTVTVISLDGVEPKPLGQTLPVVKKTVAIDLLPEMLGSKGWISDKPEGFAVTKGGEVLVVTDNDGVDDATGETLLLRLGAAAKLGL